MLKSTAHGTSLVKLIQHSEHAGLLVRRCDVDMNYRGSVK